MQYEDCCIPITLSRRACLGEALRRLVNVGAVLQTDGGCGHGRKMYEHSDRRSMQLQIRAGTLYND